MSDDDDEEESPEWSEELRLLIEEQYDDTLQAWERRLHFIETWPDIWEALIRLRAN